MRFTPDLQHESDILGLTPEQLVTALYERLLEHLRRALVAIEAPDPTARCHHLDRAVAIVLELMVTLDFERGGEIAPRLMALYTYLTSELVAIGRTLDAELLRRIIEIVAGLHESWEQAARATAPDGNSSHGAAMAVTSSFA